MMYTTEGKRMQREEETTLDVADCLTESGSDWWDSETMEIRGNVIEVISYAGNAYTITVEAINE